MLRPIIESLCAVGLALALACPGLAQAQDDIYKRCARLLEAAAGHLAAEQYPTMLKVAEERQRICPGPVSAFLVGLAQANMVDNLLISDPAERERMRLTALRNLKVAAAGGEALKLVWRFTAHDWIVHLQRLGPPVGGRRREGGEQIDGGEPPPVPLQTPPPPPRPRFPLGPVISGGAGIGALIVALVAWRSAVNKADTVDEAEQYIRDQRAMGKPVSENVIATATERNKQAATLRNWAIGLSISGGAAVLSGAVWYLLFPPHDGWRWAVSPGSIGLTARF